MEPLTTQPVVDVTPTEDEGGASSGDASASWISGGHEVSEKDTDWYWVLWILAGSLTIASLIFLQFITAVLIIVVGVTLTLLAKTEQVSQVFTINAEGVKVDSLFYPFSTFRGYDIIVRENKVPLLILATNAVLNPRLFIHVPESVEPDDLADLLDNFMPQLNEGIPLSHQIVEYLGL